MENEQENEIAEKQETAIGAAKPRGMEGGLDNSDMIIPRAMLIQNTPPRNIEIDRKTCYPGTIINSLLAEPLVETDGKIIFIPVIIGRKWIRWNAQEEKLKDGSPNPLFDPNFPLGGMIWSSRNPNDKRVLAEGEWGKNGEKPLATKTIECLAIVVGQEMPVVISFSKTSFKAGKTLASLISYSGKDAFAFKYRLSSKEEKNEQKQAYYVLNVTKVGPTNPEELKAAEQMYNGFVNREIKVHGEETEYSEPVSEKAPWE